MEWNVLRLDDLPPALSKQNLDQPLVSQPLLLSYPDSFLLLGGEGHQVCSQESQPLRMSPLHTCVVRGLRAVSVHQRVLSPPVKSREYSLSPDVLQTGGRGPHHVVISASVIALSCSLWAPEGPEGLSPGADDHAASLVVGEAIVTDCGVRIRCLGIQPGLVREINCDGTIRHPLSLTVLYIDQTNNKEGLRRHQIFI